MTMRKRLLSLLLLLALSLGLGAYSAAAQAQDSLEDKARYVGDPLYIDLDLNPAESTDDNNFVVMQEGSVILYADSGMRIVAAEDKTSYTLYNPTSEALGIAPGTPVAFIDSTKQEAFFFVPIQVTVQSDRIVFACSPEKVESDYLFRKIGISVDKTFPFEYKNFNFTNPAGTLTFKTNLNGDFHIKLSYNGISIAAETWVSYNLQDAVIDISNNFAQEIPIIKLPIAGVPGIGLEVGVGLGLFTEGDTKVSFDLTGGKAGFTAKGGILSPSFSSLSEQPQLNVEEITAEGDFEVDITFGPSIDLLSVAGLGCDIAEGICVSAELTGDEGGRDPNPLLEVKPNNPNVWHVCKELSCLQGEIDMLGKLEAWFQLAGHVWSVDYELFRVKISDFHYSFTFKEFKMELCQHYLYQVAVRVLEEGSKKPMEGVTVTYTEVPPYSDRRGKAYIEGVTDKDGYVHLYMPAADDPEKDNVQITATSWQGDPDDPQQKVKKTVEYLVKETGQEQQTEIELPLYHYMELVYFEENAGNDTVENMPQPFWVEQYQTGNIPNEVPRRVNWHFVEWNTKEDGSGERYFPGEDIPVRDKNIQLFAIWTSQPATDFRTITYDPNGENVVLADNPQIYKFDNDGFILLNPWREDYIFTGWTCKEIGLTEPQLQVTVQCSDPDGNDYVHRTYVAHWKHVTYNVIWRNWDGSVLDISRDVPPGTTPDELVSRWYEGGTPVRLPDEQYSYTFSHWTPELVTVTADAEYVAVYTAEPLPTAGQPVVPPTGDGFPLEAVLALMALSAGALLLLARLAKRRNA